MVALAFLLAATLPAPDAGGVTASDVWRCEVLTGPRPGKRK